MQIIRPAFIRFKTLLGLTQKGKIPPSVLPKGREVLLPRPVGEGRGEGSA